MEATSAATAGKTTIVDVREPDEWEAVHVKDAVHIPLANFLDKEKLDKVIAEHISKIEGEVCVTCFQSRKRGPTAASALISRLKEQGHDTSHITVLQGGVEAVTKTPELQDVLEGNDTAGTKPTAH